LAVHTKFDMGQFIDTIRPESTIIGFSFLNADEDHSRNHPHKIKPLYEGSFLKMRELGESDISLGLGIKANYTLHYLSLPLGAELKYALPPETVIPISFHTSLYYAPEVLSMIDAREYLELGVSMDIELIKGGSLTVGYRRIETNYEFNNYNVNSIYNDSGYLGYKLAF
ncbi:MAG: YfaZ family outer membrane protein, partial [Campylobacterota bacterium]|nr:YfaZ family outer membrane protein [Campylobacterota bacterium]